ncbi:MAG: hypothetical protein JNK52_16585 [Zoogloeaceae bacterium]|nr:hypothetical protein [Zoogloeaceae bacterium]
MTIRHEALAAIARNPGAPLDELAPMIKTENPKAARQAIIDLKKAGLATVARDDVTGQPGYTLTKEGKARLADGPASKQGSNMIKGAHFGARKEPQPAVGNNTGSGASVPHDTEGAAVQQPQPEQPAEPPTAEPAAADDTITKLDEALREANNELAFVREYLSEIIGGEIDPNDMSESEIARTAAGEFTQVCEEIVAQAQIIAAQRDAITQRNAELDNERALTDKLKHLLASKTHECDAMRGATCLSGADRYTAAGYIVTASKRKPRRIMNPEKAVAAAKSTIKAGAQRADVFALVPIGRAVRGAEWRKA